MGLMIRLVSSLAPVYKFVSNSYFYRLYTIVKLMFFFFLMTKKNNNKNKRFDDQHPAKKK